MFHQTLSSALEKIASAEDLHKKKHHLFEIIKSGTIDELKTVLDTVDLTCTHDGITPLLHAARLGNHVALKMICDKGVSIKTHDEKGMSVLHHAVFGGSIDCVKEVLQVDGLDVNHRDIVGRTALHYACSQEYSPDVLKELLKVDRLNVNIKDDDGETALHRACNFGLFGCVALLLQVDGLELDCQNKLGDTPLHIACKKGYQEVFFLVNNQTPPPNYLLCIKELLRKGADKTILNDEEQTPVMIARELQEISFVKALRV